MELEFFISAVRELADVDGIIADDCYWAARNWLSYFENGLTPSEAWDAERNPALRAL